MGGAVPLSAFDVAAAAALVSVDVVQRFGSVARSAVAAALSYDLRLSCLSQCLGLVHNPRWQYVASDESLVALRTLIN